MFKNSLKLMKDLKKKIKCDKMYYYEVYMSDGTKIYRNKINGYEARNIIDMSIRQKDCVAFWYEENDKAFELYSYIDYGVVGDFVILKEEEI